MPSPKKIYFRLIYGCVSAFQSEDEKEKVNDPGFFFVTWQQKIFFSGINRGYSVQGRNSIFFRQDETYFKNPWVISCYHSMLDRTHKNISNSLRLRLVGEFS